MKKLSPNYIAILYFRGLLTTFFSFIPLSAVITPILVTVNPDLNNSMGIGIAIVFVVLLWLLLPLGYAIVAYNNYCYDVVEDRIKIEKGILWKKYISIPFNKIQNVDILRGPMNRILGISDLQIQTAGMSAISTRFGSLAEGRLPGLSKDEAEKLCEELLKKITK